MRNGLNVLERKKSYKIKESPSRRFPPRVMFVAVTSLSAQEEKWECGLLLNKKSLKETVNTTRKEKLPLKLFRAIFFFNLLDQSVFPICEQLGIKELQMDNARPHIVDNKEASIKTVQQKHPSVKIIYQPPNTPETNPLDEEIFKILADAVEDRNPTTKENLMQIVKKTWK